MPTEIKDNQESMHSTGEVNTALALLEKNAVARIEGLLGTIGQQAVHNFQGTPEEIWRLTARANSPDALSMAEARDKEIAVVYFYAHHVQIAGPANGEYADAIRCVLIDSKGVTFAFVSDGIAADLAQMIYTFGLKPWSPPVLVKPVEVKTRRGFRTYRLVPA
jgi:hypothetical protein